MDEDLDNAPYLLRNMVEANGKTIKQNNMARTHSVKIGALVELESGVRLFVVRHHRDCDGTPLYGLSAVEQAQFEDDPPHNWVGGYGESDLRVVRRRSRRL